MINIAHGKTTVIFGHKRIQISRKKILGHACMRFADNKGDTSKIELEPSVALVFKTRDSLDCVARLLEEIKEWLWDDPNEIELEYF